MKNILFLFILIVGAGCTEKRSTPSEQITAYYEGFENSDFSQIKRTLSDSLISIEGDFKMAYSRESYYEKFKWDSVFRPVYTLVSIENEDEQPIVTVTMNSLKHEFLKNNPMTCRYRFHFQSGKIAKIENLDCADANWEVWGKEVDSLVNWVESNHPELDGFIYDLTMQGAQNYIKAIALYNNRKNTP